MVGTSVLSYLNIFFPILYFSRLNWNVKNYQVVNGAFDNDDIGDAMAKGFSSSNNSPDVNQLDQVKTQDKTVEGEGDKEPGGMF